MVLLQITFFKQKKSERFKGNVAILRGKNIADIVVGSDSGTPMSDQVDFDAILGFHTTRNKLLICCFTQKFFFRYFSISMLSVLLDVIIVGCYFLLSPSLSLTANPSSFHPMLQFILESV